MENSHVEFLQQAIDLAVENVRSGHGGPFGAIVVKDGEIIGRGVNTVTAENDPTAHAEINAVRDACQKTGDFQLRGCDIYSSCEPCPMCLGAIYWARPARLFYAASARDAANAGFDDSFIYQEIEKAHEKRSIPFIPIQHQDALKAFNEWNNNEKKTVY